MNKKVFLISAGIVLLLGAGCSQKQETLVAPPGAETPPAMVKKESPPRYAAYSKAAFDAAGSKKRVYFFHAKWCPSCKVADAAFSANPDKIPEGAVVFKTDYDTETELKNKFGITYQHTFVFVDASGNEIKKWNGGGPTELQANIQ